ncbi:uncharacterized protein LOC142009716 isoform X2 [Carettochelys insculpta]|uniref:uncharacterized protein LOC142009716 isoform X2 n=1 Tax=Carettochelys insculpta TaxID=44489 RepID=UPI003EBE548E
MAGNVEMPVISGDPAYPLLPGLMKPYTEALDPSKENLNHRLSRCRMVVECTFGHLKVAKDDITLLKLTNMEKENLLMLSDEKSGKFGKMLCGAVTPDRYLAWQDQCCKQLRRNGVVEDLRGGSACTYKKEEPMEPSKLERMEVEVLVMPLDNIALL